MENIRKDETLAERSDPTPSTFSLKESPKKCNLSFSFNIEFDEANSDNSSDSETADLQIDVSEIDNYESSCKHKRELDEEASSVLNEMEEEIERQLDAKAAKTNLTATNVKNILKHVITNEQVMAMVQKQLYDAEDDVIFEPKLTRAKAKQLAAAQVNIPWPITPVKKASSEVQVLIEGELPEDSSDEEYNPEHDKQSDDESKETENCRNSDVEPQPSTSANSCISTFINYSVSSDAQYDADGVFKIPGTPHVPTEEESIGQRTRSKLCLSETSLEQIEQAFIPPDITTDMYDWDCEVDEDWDKFLKEFTQPLNQEAITEDDPDADPEYNILEDEETDLLDKEELRADKAVKVTRKELNNLIAELFEFTDTFSKQEQEISRKKRSIDNSNPTIDASSMNYSMTDLLPVLTEPEFPELLNPEQLQVLTTQICQHIQLMVQHFVLTYMHPDLHSQSKACKQNLNTMRYLSNSPYSTFNGQNLTAALKLVCDWENKFLDKVFSEEYKQRALDEVAINKIYRLSKSKYTPRFHPELKKLFLESKALMFPELLPKIPFKSECSNCTRSPYLKSEEHLIALGLEQFLPFVAAKPRKFKGKRLHLVDTVQMIIHYLLPCRDLQGLLHHIQKRRYGKDQNPIKVHNVHNLISRILKNDFPQYFYEKSYAPKPEHLITSAHDLKAPKDQPLHQLPAEWQTCLNNHTLHSCNDVVTHEQPVDRNSTGSIQIANTFFMINPCQTASTNALKADGIMVHMTGNDTSSIPEAISRIENLPKMSENIESSISTAMTEKRILLSENLNDKENGDMEIVDIDKRVEEKDTLISLETMVNPPTTKKSTEIPHEVPQLRKTTPRLAKTRSAQNMKLMAQVLGSKGLSSNCSVLKSREKHDVAKSAGISSMPPKVDNEDEIAELMLASTTIKKDSFRRKKAKEARELENLKRLLESENPLNEEERESKFTTSYLQKLHLTLESNNPEIFRAVIKLYLDYNDKLENVNQIGNQTLLSAIHERDKDSIAIDLYREMCKQLEEYPELCSDFLLFLKPHQAAIIDKSVEYIMLQKMCEFINVTQIYFAKQPSRISKMMQAITQLSSDPHTNIETINSIMGPILKGHPLVMDLFLQVLPTAKPPESLFASNMFENLTCPLGPYDKNKIYNKDAAELYECVELSALPCQEDPYGGENCRCSCHIGDENNFKIVSEHCVSCGTRFLNGRLYLQTSEGLRPAKITFPGEDQEKRENLARVSLKITDKFIPPAPSKQRRKASKNESICEETFQRQCVTKNTTVADIEVDKALIKSKKSVKTSSKSEDKKDSLKRFGSVDHSNINTKRIRLTQYKNRRESKIDQIELNKRHEVICRREQNELTYTKSQSFPKDSKRSRQNVNIHTFNVSRSEKCFDSQGTYQFSSSAATECKTTNDSLHSNSVYLSKVPVTDLTERKSCTTNSTPWTRWEDTILLQNIKKEYSEHSIAVVSKLLGNRTIDEVGDRCRTLLSLLERMT